MCLAVFPSRAEIIVHKLVQFRFFGIPMPYAVLIDGDISFWIEPEAGEYFVTLAILSMRGLAVPEVKNITLKKSYI